MLLLLRAFFSTKFSQKFRVRPIRRCGLDPGKYGKLFLSWSFRYLNIAAEKPFSGSAINTYVCMLPFRGHLSIDLYFSSQSSNFSVLGVKTRPLKSVDLDGSIQ